MADEAADCFENFENCCHLLANSKRPSGFDHNFHPVTNLKRLICIHLPEGKTSHLWSPDISGFPAGLRRGKTAVEGALYRRK